MKRKIMLATPIERGDGLTQNHFEIDRIHVREDGYTVYTTQGNSINLLSSPKRKKDIEEWEDAALEELMNPSPQSDGIRP